MVDGGWRMSIESSQRGNHLRAEINEQPEALDRLTSVPSGILANVARRIERFAPRMVLIAARGTSDNAALYAKYLIEIELGLPVGLVSPSTTTVYEARPVRADVLFVAISQSGGSPDLLASLTDARQRGALTLSVTNSPNSALAMAAELHIDVMAGPERAVAATKSYTNELLALYLLVESLRGGDGRSARELSRLAAEAIELTTRAEGIAERYRFTQRLVTTGRGLAYPTALEAALKIMETSYISAQPFSGADLLHGPVAMIDPTLPVIAVQSSHRSAEALIPVIGHLTDLGADIITVGSSPTASLRTPAGVPETLAPIIDVIPLQLLALHTSLQRGLDPDAPRGLLKVTQTR